MVVPNSHVDISLVDSDKYLSLLFYFLPPWHVFVLTLSLVFVLTLFFVFSWLWPQVEILCNILRLASLLSTSSPLFLPAYVIEMLFFVCLFLITTRQSWKTISGYPGFFAQSSMVLRVFKLYPLVQLCLQVSCNQSFICHSSPTEKTESFIHSLFAFQLDCFPIRLLGG